MGSIDFDRKYDGWIMSYLEKEQVYVRDMYAGADKNHRLGVRFVTTMSWHNLFCYNLFIQPEPYKLKDFTPDFTVICCPAFKGDSKTEGIRKENFTIINFEKKMVLIGGTEYSGEIKKGIFSVLNFNYPLNSVYYLCIVRPIWELKSGIRLFSLDCRVPEKPHYQPIKIDY